MKSFRLSILYELSLAASLIKVKIIIRATLKKRANRLAKDDKWLVILHKWSNEIEMWNQYWNLKDPNSEIWIIRGRYGANGASRCKYMLRCTCFTLLTDCSACVTFSENVLSSSDNVLVSVFPGWKNDDSQSGKQRSIAQKLASHPTTYYDVHTSQAISSSQLQLLRTGLQIKYTKISVDRLIFLSSHAF